MMLPTMPEVSPTRSIASNWHDLQPTEMSASSLGSNLLKIMTQVGENWNQLILEMNSWYHFGRDLEDALNNKQNSTLELVK